MNKTGKVAIITRTKNRNILLERAIKSAENQTYKNWIQVIVNDGGDSKSLDELINKKFSHIKDKLLIIHNKESLGMEAASNLGIKSVDSEFIIIHDDDDSWNPQFLEKTVEFLNQSDEYKGVITYSTRVIEKIENDNVKIVSTESFNSWIGEAISLYRMAAQNVFPPISFLFKREVIQSIGLFDEKLPVLGDWDFNLRFIEKYDIFVIQEELANYHHRLETKSGDYSNSVIGGKNKHFKYDILVRNKYLRNDIQQGKQGLGFLINISKSFEILHGQVGIFEKIIYKLSNTKFAPILRRIVK